MNFFKKSEKISAQNHHPMGVAQWIAPLLKVMGSNRDIWIKTPEMRSGPLKRPHDVHFPRGNRKEDTGNNWQRRTVGLRAEIHN